MRRECNVNKRQLLGNNNTLNMFTRPLFLLLLLWGQDARSVRILEMRVPADVREGDSAILSCQYDLGNDQLYSVKWYKDGQEFYRYVPMLPNATKYFQRSGINVNMARSTSTLVVLDRITRESEGEYECEVAGEAPSFFTTSSSKRISVYTLPDSGPYMTGMKEQYEFDDIAVVNCTSSASRPTAQLAWLVNEQPAAAEDVRGPWHRVSPDRPYAIETTLQLRFKVAPRHFVGSTMKLKCLATVAPFYQGETDSTHYIGLPFTKITEGSPLEVSLDPNGGSSITKHTKAGFLLHSVLSLILLQIV